MFLIISKLPTDLQDVMHILPFWFTYLYWFLIVCGVALIAILLIFAVSRLINYFKIINEGNKLKYAKTQHQMSRDELVGKLKAIVDAAQKCGNYRQGLHDMTSLLRTYFEIQLKQEIEEMTAYEIRHEVKSRKDIGDFFTAVSTVQFHAEPPAADDLKNFYQLALKVAQ